MAAALRALVVDPPKEELDRRELCEAARELYLSLETPLEAMHRLYWSMEMIPVAQIGVDIGLFRKLSEQPHKSWTVVQLGKALNVDETLLHRIIRYFASFAFIHEASDGTYSANVHTSWLATPGGEGGLKHYYLNISPVLQHLPNVLRRQKYQNPGNPTDTAFQVAHNTDVHCYSYVPDDRSRITAFLDFMQSQRATQQSWIDAFPIDHLQLSDADVASGRALFVDVGGAGGHQCLELRRRAPQLQGRVVLQDQERVIEGVDVAGLARQGVEAMSHDFFRPQPVAHAKAYYLRNIMHDWPDSKCAGILAHLRAAMREDSVILIDDMVLPDTGANWKQAQKDVQMMAVAAAMERSVSQWKSLLVQAGLCIRATHTYDSDLGDSIIVAVRA